MLRLTLPLEAETHPHLQTSGHRSKFGLFFGSPDHRAAVRFLAGAPEMHFIGIHTHLGSQITDACIYQRAGQQLVTHAEELRDQGFPIEEVSMGGGWAVSYTPSGGELVPEQVANALCPLVADSPWLRLAVEPGRMLVARSGIALYTVGATKQVGDRRIVAVNGGMGDNPRPPLYGARYTAIAPEKLESTYAGSADVAGRYCESGDILAREVPLPLLDPGDLLCIPVSGAYQISMASPYNLVPQPAVVLVDHGSVRLLTRRATITDLFAREVVE